MFETLNMNPGFASNIFKYIHQEAGRYAPKLARSLEKSTYKLEAHHRHLNFTHRTLEITGFPSPFDLKHPATNLSSNGLWNARASTV
jgi:hypothetical protein